LGGGVEGEPPLPGPLQAAAQHVTGAALEVGAVQVRHVAEDPRHRSLVGPPRKDLKGLGIGPGQDVALLDPAEPVDRRAVERHALLEGVLQLGRRDAEGLQCSQDVDNQSWTKRTPRSSTILSTYS